MKKAAAILVMIFFLLAAGAGTVWLSDLSQDEAQKVSEKNTKQKNPIPPDEKALEEYGLAPFVSELPVLMVDTGGQQILKEKTVWAEVAVLDDSSGRNDILGEVDDVLTATIKYRGASSYSRFDKPQYRLKFYWKEGGKALDYDLFGMGADSEWVLNGPFLDKTLLRNYLMYNLSGEVMDWAPGCTFFELFVDQKYQGVYLAVEPVTDGIERLNLNQFGLASGATPYIVKRDRMNTEENVLHTYGELHGYTGQQLSVAYPGSSSLTNAQRRWIEQDINQFEEALYADYFDDPQIGYAHYIDVDSFVDYYVLNEFSLNHDAGVLSTYLYKDLNGKMKLCMWDYNNGFDNYQWFPMETDKFHLTDNYWFDRLLQDRAFVDRVVSRYRELRKTTLSDQHIQTILNTGLQQLGDAIERNFAVWGYTFSESLRGSLEDPESYEEAMEQLRRVIDNRLQYMDGNMEKLYECCEK